jgi:hypothetical protein
MSLLLGLQTGGPTFSVTIAATSAFTPSLTTRGIFSRTLAVTGTWTPAIQKFIGFHLSVTSAFAVAMTKQVTKTLAVTSVFLTGMVKKVFLTLVTTSTFVVAMQAAAIFRRTLAATSTFVANLVTVYIPFFVGDVVSIVTGMIRRAGGLKKEDE